MPENKRGRGRPAKYSITDTLRTCSSCKVEQEISAFSPSRLVAGRWKHESRCYTCRASDKRRYAYGIMGDEYESMLAAQNFSCAICRQPFKGPKDTHTDHCHVTQKVRGILCQECNQGLGKFKDSPDLLKSAIDYLS